MKASFIVIFAVMAWSAGPAFGQAPEAAKADIGLEEKLGHTIAALDYSQEKRRETKYVTCRSGANQW